MKMLRDLLILVVAALIANWAVEKWVLRPTDDAPTGFVTIKPGFGMDDLARPLGFAIVAMLAHKFMPG